MWLTGKEMHMNLKKLLLFAGMALTAVAVVAPVASGNWLHSGSAFSGERTISAQGTFKFETILGGVHCTGATANFVIVGGSSTGRLESFPITRECFGSGALEGCRVARTDLTGEPILHQNSSDIVVTNVTLWAEYEQEPKGPECGVLESELDFEGFEIITVQVDPSKGEISTLTLSAPNGGVLTAFGLEVGNVGVEGSLSVIFNNGTYGFS
jgi:hypothetical protein